MTVLLVWLVCANTLDRSLHFESGTFLNRRHYHDFWYGYRILIILTSIEAGGTLTMVFWWQHSIDGVPMMALHRWYFYNGASIMVATERQSWVLRPVHIGFSIRIPTRSNPDWSVHTECAMISIRVKCALSQTTSRGRFDLNRSYRLGLASTKTHPCG